MAWTASTSSMCTTSSRAPTARREASEARWRELIDGGGWRALDELRARGRRRGDRRSASTSAQPCERLLALARSRPLPARRPLHPAGAGAAGDGLLPACERRGVGVVDRRPVQLRRPGAGAGRRPYDYAAAPRASAGAGRAAARRVCARFGVAAAGRRAAVRRRRIRRWSASSPAGRRRGEVAANAALLDAPIPAGALGGAEGRGADRSGRADAGDEAARMLKGIDPLLGPELLATLRAMGHGDEIVIVDANFPAAANARRLIRAEGVGADADGRGDPLGPAAGAVRAGRRLPHGGRRRAGRAAAGDRRVRARCCAAVGYDGPIERAGALRLLRARPARPTPSSPPASGATGAT